MSEIMSVYVYPPLRVEQTRDLLDWVSLGINFILGLAAIVSLLISRKALRKSEFDSAMSTSPSIIVRPRDIWVGLKRGASVGYAVPNQGHTIKKSENYEITFFINFECFNAGRGVAFNISKPLIEGMDLSTSKKNQTPLYMTLGNDSFEVEIMIKRTFDQFYEGTHAEVPVAVLLTYTNDQGNIFCRSTWTAKIKPFDRDGDDLKIREIRVLGRNGRIEYSQKPFKT